MRTQATCLALAIVLLCPFASAQWVQTNFDINGSVSCLAVNGTNLFVGIYSGIYSTTGSGVFLSTDNGTSWTAASEGLPRAEWDITEYAPIYCLGMCGQNLFAGTGSGVFLSTNNGTSWTAVNEGLPKDEWGNTPIRCFGTSGTNLFAGIGYVVSFANFDGGVFLSTNNGTSWTSVNTGFPSPWVDDLAVSGANLVATSMYGVDNMWDYVFFSTNSGTSWTAVDSGLGQQVRVTALAASGTNFIAGTGGGAFRSTNNGRSWTAVNEGLAYDIINDTTRSYPWISCFAASGTNLFAGTGQGVFLSTNNGTSWTAVNTGLTSTFVGSVVVSGTNLFATIKELDSYTHDIWRRPLSEMITDVETSWFLPSSISLHQNYPNPFNPSTTITYELPVSSDVRLSVYDLLGREVSVLVDERKDAGVHEVTYDGSRLASGVYLYRLTAGSFVETRKLIYVR